MKAKGLIETSEYQQAIEVLEFLMEVDPTHEEGKQELLRAQKLLKTYLNNEDQMCKKMF